MKTKLLFPQLFIILIVFTVNESKAFMFWNQACNFLGTPSSYVAFASSQVSVNLTGSFTLEAWVHPFNSTSPSSQYIISKNSATFNGYFMKLGNGKVQIGTNFSTRITGATTLSNNKWTHICGTFDAFTNTFRVYINGVLDGTAIISGAASISNTDSLRIGKTYSIFPNSDFPFKGYIDEVRIWGKALTSTEIIRYKNTSLAAEGECPIPEGGEAPYCNLRFSLTFQDINGDGGDFILRDWQSENIGRNIGVTAIDLNDRPSTTVHPNECIELDGIYDYLIGGDNIYISPTSEITMEAWIYPRSVFGIKTIIHKGPSPGGSGTDYSLRLNGAYVNAVINGIVFNSASLPTVTTGSWAHVAFTYRGSDGKYQFYVNGKDAGGGFNDRNNITNDADALIIGGAGGNFFDGYIDEVRISNYVKSLVLINKFLYRSIDDSNEPNDASNNVVYNFDGNAYDNSDGGPELTFYNSARFNHPAGISNTPISPIDRKDNSNFQEGFYLKTSRVRIPFLGSTGTIIDSFNIGLDTIITDLNIYVGINHGVESELKLTLIAPNNESMILYDGQSLVGNNSHLITIFDDQADSNVTNNGKFLSFAPSIKPRNRINPIFTGDHSRGWWKLRIDDLSGTGTGRLYVWGVQINNMPRRFAAFAMRLSPEGFIRTSPFSLDSKEMKNAAGSFYLSKSDTMCFDFVTPSGLNIASACVKNDSIDGISHIILNTGNDYLIDSSYYIIASHRNSIKVSTANPQHLIDPLNPSLYYDFTVDDSTAYGNNLALTSGGIWAMYSGDVNQDCIIDLNDLSLIDNAAFSFVTGYSGEDITGDNFVDLSDLLIADNNSSMFVNCILP